MLRCRRLTRLPLLMIVIASIGVAGACAADDVPEVPVAADGSVDPELVDGRRVYIDRCANCHGNAGGGGRGTKLSEGLMIQRYPDIDAQIRIVVEGVRAMPGFDEVLDAGQVRSVVRYTREVL